MKRKGVISMYKDLDWNSLLKARDSLLLLGDLGIVNLYDGSMGEILKDINDEIDRRYKLDNTSGITN